MGRWYEGGIGDLLAAARDPGDPAGDAALPVLTSLLREGIAAVEILSVLEHLAALPADLSRPESPAMHRLTSLADTTQAIIETRRDDWPEALGLRQSPHEELASSPAWRRGIPAHAERSAS